MKAIKFFRYIIVMVLTTFAITSCSSDDEPSGFNGEAAAESVRSQVLNKDGKIRFPESTSTKGVYIVAASSMDEAKDIAKNLCGEEWDGNAKTVNFGNGLGNIKLASVNENEEGVFCTMIFTGVKGVPDFTLKIATEAYCASENYIVRF
ncbi:MAG: hypothetical protein LUC45_02005 [Paraprevotella sp.]|nr:hypothetical protein [Paraprevotella sp.]